MGLGALLCSAPTSELGGAQEHRPHSAFQHFPPHLLLTSPPTPQIPFSIQWEPVTLEGVRWDAGRARGSYMGVPFPDSLGMEGMEGMEDQP